MRETHADFIRETIRLAELAVEHGNEPFGALLACDGKTLLVAENTIFSDHDVTRHAEMNLVSMASKSISPEILARSTLYSNTEPCAMCSTAIYWAKIPRVVYGCPAEALSRIKGSGFLLPSREVFARGTRAVEVVGPILADEALEIHRKYWKA